MPTIFSEVPITAPQTSMFQLNHDVKLTLEQGYLVPVLCQDVLPGDHWKMSVNAFVRFMPMIAPVMQRFDIKLEVFFIPYRLIWDNWETFITGGPEGDDDSHAYPEIRLGFTDFEQHYFTNGSLADYLGFPTVDPNDDFNDYIGEGQGISIDALPFRAYQLVYDEYYRDQNVTGEIDIRKGDDGVMVNPGEYRPLLTLRKRAWKKDYFTSALPFVQRGTDVLLPVGNPNTAVQFQYGGPSQLVVNSGTITGGRLAGASTGANDQRKDISLFTRVSGDSTTNSLDRGGIAIDNSNSLYVDTQNAEATINDLRTAYALQRFKERNAVGGARYKEQLLAHFGVTVPDARLQRPEFLGAASAPIVIGEVLQTSQTTEESSPSGASVLGGFAGHGLGVNDGFLFDEKFLEHGLVMCLMSVVPRASYQQGMPRRYSRRDRYDFAWPEFAHLGEQAILEQEIFYQFPAQSFPRVENDSTFGYQSRFAEYKYILPTVHGAMRDSLDYWHSGRIFDTPPELSTSFITSNPTNRIFAVTNTDSQGVPTSYQHHLVAQVAFDIRAVRPLPRFATPSL